MTPQEEASKKWLLSRMRTIRAGILLIVAQIDEIGIELSENRITPELAMRNVTALEQMPVHFAAHVFSPGE